MLFHGIPRAAGGTAALPLWGLVATGGAEKYGFRLCHDGPSPLFRGLIIPNLCLVVKVIRQGRCDDDADLLLIIFPAEQGFFLWIGQETALHQDAGAVDLFHQIDPFGLFDLPVAAGIDGLAEAGL